MTLEYTKDRNRDRMVVAVTYDPADDETLVCWKVVPRSRVVFWEAGVLHITSNHSWRVTLSGGLSREGPLKFQLGRCLEWLCL